MSTVLLADRNPDTRRILRDYLGASGYDVRPCSTPEEVLALLEFERPAAVIVELFDMGPDGLELVREIAEGEHGPVVPVLVYTSDPRRSLVRKTRSMGVRLLTKPASPRSVLQALEALLAGNKPDVFSPGVDDTSNGLQPPGR